jgi:hypothetical protein
MHFPKTHKTILMTHPPRYLNFTVEANVKIPVCQSELRSLGFLDESGLKEQIDLAFRGFTWGLYEEVLKKEVKTRKRKFEELERRSYTPLGGSSHEEEMKLLLEKNRRLEVHPLPLLYLTKLGDGGPDEEEDDQPTSGGALPLPTWGNCGSYRGG